MTTALTHFGATPRTTAYRAADVANVPAGISITGQAARDFQVSNVRPVAPTENSAEAREQARQQVMARRGVDMISIFNMSAQDRIAAEVSIKVEAARRTNIATVQATGNFVDLRV